MFHGLIFHLLSPFAVNRRGEPVKRLGNMLATNQKKGMSSFPIQFVVVKAV